MKRFFPTLLLGLAALVCSGAEIVGWKVPLTRISFQGLEEPAFSRLAAAPEASPFFRAGDELWRFDPTLIKDQPLDGALERLEITQTMPPIQWAVWNSTLGRLVVKGEWNSIWQMQQRLRIDQLPQQCRVTAEVTEAPVNGAAGPDQSATKAILSWVGKSGTDCEATRENDWGSVSAQGTASIGERSSIVDLKLAMTCAPRNGTHLKFQTNLILSSGVPVWVAHDDDGLNGISCRISCNIVLLDGTPVSEATMIQKANALLPLIVDPNKMITYEIEGAGQLAVQYMEPGNILSSVSPEQAFFEEPWSFGPDWAKKHGLNELQIPTTLRPWFDEPVWDLRDYIKKSGLEIRLESDVVGYCPSLKRIFMLSRNGNLINQFAQLNEPSCNLLPKQLITTVRGHGESMLVTASGVRGAIQRIISGQKEIRSVIVEASQDESDLVTMILELDEASTGERKQSLKTKVTLQVGQPTMVLEGAPGDESDSPVRLATELRYLKD